MQVTQRSSIVFKTCAIYENETTIVDRFVHIVIFTVKQLACIEPSFAINLCTATQLHVDW